MSPWHGSIDKKHAPALPSAGSAWPRVTPLAEKLYSDHVGLKRTTAFRKAEWVNIWGKRSKQRKTGLKRQMSAVKFTDADITVAASWSQGLAVAAAIALHAGHQRLAHAPPSHLVAVVTFRAKPVTVACCDRQQWTVNGRIKYQNKQRIRSEQSENYWQKNPHFFWQWKGEKVIFTKAQNREKWLIPLVWILQKYNHHHHLCKISVTHRDELLLFFDPV